MLAVNFLSDIEPLVISDDPRPVATNARVRIVHASPTAQDVDIYVAAPGTDIATIEATLTSVTFKANTGFIPLAAGDYEVTVTPAGTKTAAILAPLSIEDGGVYTAIARDPLPGESDLNVLLFAE